MSYVQSIKYLNSKDYYSILQYVNQCWESERERKHKWEKREFMLVYAFQQIFMSSIRWTDKIIKNYCYVPRNWTRIFNLIAKLLKTTVNYTLISRKTIKLSSNLKNCEKFTKVILQIKRFTMQNYSSKYSLIFINILS